MSDYFDLGAYSRRVTTDSSDAQLWCDRGRVWCYAYNHEAAIECFDKALDADPACPFAHWGIAYAAGCNYNKPWEAFDEDDASRSLARARRHAALAHEHRASADAVEAALIEAIQSRYQQDKVPQNTVFCQWNDDYASAMREVYHRFSDDLDVTTLFGEAIMNRTPWAMWDLPTGAIPEGASTREAIDVLERALECAQAWTHPGLLHVYVHLMEMSPYPERALKVADALRNLVPDAGHLKHMPTHIDVLCGHYERVVSSNDAAIAADRRYLQRVGPLNFYSLYRCHNYHFKIYGTMFLGQYKPALVTANEMVATLPDKLLREPSPPMADWLEGFISMTQHVFIRFGKWQEIVDQTMPEDQELYCVTTAMMHYAKAVAFAATGKLADAQQQADFFDEAYERVPESRMLFNNTCRDILTVAREMMLGEIEYRKANFVGAFEHLRRSVELDDNLPYDEPWGWMQPTRHALGALLLERGQIDEAADVYRADLGLDSSLPRALQHPDNIWSLKGYHECLTRLGRNAEAAIIEQRLTLASGRTDVSVKSSCFCKQGSV